jgi:hypothetical protein
MPFILYLSKLSKVKPRNIYKKICNQGLARNLNFTAFKNIFRKGIFLSDLPFRSLEKKPNFGDLRQYCCNEEKC